LSKRRLSEIGRKAGQVSGSLRRQNFSAEQRSEIARKAAQARWKSSETRQRPKKAPAQRRKRA
jgi:general stress protein YciG